MHTPSKRPAALLLTALLLTACAASGPPSPATIVRPAQIPPPPAELMTIPETASLPNVPTLLDEWTARIERWQVRLKLCRDTPERCV